MNLVKLTNAATTLKGKPLLINSDRIVSVFEAEIDGEKVTFVYADTKDSWQVKENINTVTWLIQNPNTFKVEEPKPQNESESNITELKKVTI